MIYSKGAGAVEGMTIKALQTRERKLFCLVFRMVKSKYVLG